MNKTDKELDQQLAQADRSLLRASGTWSGDVIRRRADQRQVAQRQQRKALVTAGVVMVLLVGWRLWMPADSSQVADVIDTKPNVEERLAKIEDLRKQREQVNIQLDLLAANTKLRRLELEMERLASYGWSREVVYKRNRNTWKALEHIVGKPDEQASISDSDRRQLELLAGSFSDTVAGSIAQSILTTNQIPESLYEKSNDF